MLVDEMLKKHVDFRPEEGVYEGKAVFITSGEAEVLFTVYESELRATHRRVDAFIEGFHTGHMYATAGE